MGLPEILSILTLVLLCGVAVLLFVYIKKASTPTQQNTTDDSQMTDLLDTVYRLEQEVVRLQSELKNTTSSLRTEFQEEGAEKPPCLIFQNSAPITASGI